MTSRWDCSIMSRMKVKKPATTLRTFVLTVMLFLMSSRRYHVVRLLSLHIDDFAKLSKNIRKNRIIRLNRLFDDVKMGL
jgi:hypothetical protein